jgi:hypothetical protein
MAHAQILTESEASKLTKLAGGQPKSAKAYQALVEKVKIRTIRGVLTDQEVVKRLKGKRIAW